MFQTTRRQETGKKLSVVETDESAKLMETAGNGCMYTFSNKAACSAPQQERNDGNSRQGLTPLDWIEITETQGKECVR